MADNRLNIKITSDVREATRGLNKLTNSLEGTSKVSRSTTGDFRSFQRQTRRVNDAFNNLSRDGNRTTKVFKGLGKTSISLGNIFRGIGLYKLSGYLQQSMKSAMDMVETTHLFEVSMGNLAEETDNVIRSMAELTGMDLGNLRNRIGTMNMLGLTMGFTANNARTLAMNANQLSLDMGALFNVPYQQITEDLRSGLIGQSRTLYKYGIDVTEAAIANEALAQGISKSVRHMSQGEKMMLRHNIIVRQMAKTQGDFAQTFNTPINQLRVLTERFVTLSRTIGQVLAPTMGKIIKYANAVVIVLTRVFRKIGEFFGISMESKAENLVNTFQPMGDDIDTAMDNLDKGLGSANKKARELKKQLTGFDELNIIQTTPPETPDVGAGAGGGLGDLDFGDSPFDLDLEQYDSMLSKIKDDAMELADNIMDSLRPFFRWVKDNFDDILWISTVIGSVIIGWTVGKKLIRAFELLLKLREIGGVGSLENLVIGITMALVGFKITSSGISELVSGNVTLAEVVKSAVGMALGMGSGLMLLGATPTGWLLGGTITLLSTLRGIRIGYEKSLNSLVNDTISDNGGVLITELAEGFSRAMDGIKINLNPVIESGEKIANMKVGIEESKSSLQTLFSVIESESVGSEEAMKRLGNSMVDLLDETQALRDEAYDNVTYALVNSFSDVEKAVGKSTDSIIRDMYLIKSEGDKELSEARADVRKYEEEWQRTGDSKAYEKMMDAFNKVVEFTGDSASEITKSFDSMLYDLDSIDWESPSRRSEAMSLISENIQDVEKSTKEYLKSIEDSVELVLKDIDDPRIKEEMKNALTVVTDSEREALENEQSKQIGKLLDTMKEDLLTKTIDVADRASEEWDELSPLMRIVSGSKEQYVHDAIGEFRKNTINPMADEMGDAFGDLGVSAGADLNKALDGVIESAFKMDIYSGEVISFGTDLTTSVNKELRKMGIETSKESEEVGDGITKGLRKGAKDASEDNESWIRRNIGNPLINAYNRVFKRNSPSLVFVEMGEDLTEGLKLGMLSDFGDVNTSLSSKLNDIKRMATEKWRDLRGNIKGKSVDFSAKIPTTWSDLRGRWSNLVNNFQDRTVDFKVKLSTTVGSVKNFVNNLISSVNRNLIARLDFGFSIPRWLGGGRWSWKAPRIPYLEDGGVLNAGQLFIAREAGAELVGNFGGQSAVMNNDDIVRSVTRGVYEAVRSAMSSTNTGGNGTQQIVVQVGEDTLVDRIIDSTNRQSVVDGRTVIRV